MKTYHMLFTTVVAADITVEAEDDGQALDLAFAKLPEFRAKNVRTSGKWRFVKEAVA